MEYNLTENGEVKFTGTARQCFNALLEIYGSQTTIGEMIDRKISIDPKE